MIEGSDRQIGELESKLDTADQRAREKAQGEVTQLKRELSAKISQADSDTIQANKYKREMADQKAQQEKEIEKLANEKAQIRLKQLKNEFKAKEVGLVGYVSLLTGICFVSCVLSLIRCKTFFQDFLNFFKGFWNGFTAVTDWLLGHLQVIASLSDHINHEIGSKIVYWLILIVLIIICVGAFIMGFIWLLSHVIDIGKEKAVTTWNVSVWAILCVVFVWFGDIIKSFINFNLLGLWLIIGVVLYLIGWYINKDKW